MWTHNLADYYLLLCGRQYHNELLSVLSSRNKHENYITNRAFPNIQEGIEFIKKQELPIVLKADGLAGGKGVLIIDDDEDVNEEFAACWKVVSLKSTNSVNSQQHHSIIFFVELRSILKSC